jgi:hypothetical protein
VIDVRFLVFNIKLFLLLLGIFVGSDPDSTYFIMSVWPVKNPCRVTGTFKIFLKFIECLSIYVYQSMLEGVLLKYVNMIINQNLKP